MKALITKQIADRLEELAVQWKDHTSQAEALMMAAKEVMTFQEKEKEQKANTWNNAINAVEKDKWESFEQYYNETFNTKEK